MLPEFVVSYLSRFKTDRLPEEELVEVIKSAQAAMERGEPASQQDLDIVILHIAPLVWKHSYNAGNNDDQREDIFQAVITHLIEKLDRFDTERGVKFVTWANSLIRHAATHNTTTQPVSLTQHLSSRRANAIEHGSKHVQPLPIPEKLRGELRRNPDNPQQAEMEIVSHDSEYSLPEMQDTIITLLDDAPISDRQREMLFLHHVDGFTMQEIAEYHGITRQRVDQLLAKAREAVQVWDRVTDNKLLDILESLN